MKINKLKCPFVVLMSQLLIIYAAYYFITQPTDYYKQHRNISIIKDNMNKVARTCGEGYFVSWLVMKTSDLKDQFMFQDVIGCNKQMSKNCTFSVKGFNLNPFYNKTDHSIDRETYQFLLSIPDAEVAYFDDIQELNKYNTIKYINDNTNLQINNLSFTVIKNKKENIIYVFSLANTNKEDTCTRKKSTLLLKELAQQTKKGIY